MLCKRNRAMPMRRAALLIGDWVGIAGSIVLATYLRFSGEDGVWQEYILTHCASLTTIGFVFFIVFYAAGLYERRTLTRGVYRAVSAAVAIALALSMVMFYAQFRLAVGRGILMLAGLFIYLSASGLRSMYRLAVRHGLLSRNTLIIGQGDGVKDVLRLLRRTEDAGFKALGIITVSKRVRKRDELDGVPVLGDIHRLREIVSLHEVEALIVAASLDREPGLSRTLRPLRYAGIEILDYLSLCEEITQQIPLDHIDDAWLMSSAMNSSVPHIRQIKRTMDIVVSLLGLLATAPISLAAAILIKLDSPGPVLYRQRRAKIDGQPFTLLKFRTMRDNAELESGAIWADKDDARVTPIGRFLRSWRLDELPQLLNVLKGEMSLVGPRPERLEFIEILAERIPFYRERLLVSPGITGWAQIKFPYAASIEASRRKLQYDLYYSKHMSFLLDAQILLWTFPAILSGARHRGAGSDELPADPGGRLMPMAPLPGAEDETERKSA